MVFATNRTIHFNFLVLTMLILGSKRIKKTSCVFRTSEICFSRKGKASGISRNKNRFNPKWPKRGGSQPNNQKGDRVFLNAILVRDKPSNGYNSVLVGYSLIALGVGVSTATYVGVFNLVGTSILFYGPILAGIGMVAFNKKSSKRER